MIFPILIFAAGLYLLVLAILCLFQRQLIFAGAGVLRAARPAAAGGSEWLTLSVAHRGHVVALYGNALSPLGAPVSEPRRHPTILYCYGNGGTVENAADQFESFRRLGCNVIVADYPGYGYSPGTASEAGCYAAADAEYDYLATRDPEIASRLILVGWSLGSGVAIDLASRRPCAGLATFSAFTNMAEAGQHQYPVFPLVILRPLIRYRFLNERKIARVRCPILIVHGERDPMIPISMASRLAAAAGGPVTRVNIPDAHHGDIFDADAPAAYAALGKFVAQFTNFR